MKTADWFMIFEEIATSALKEATIMSGTPEAKEELGIGAGGDVTIGIDRLLEDKIIESLEKVGNVRLISEEMGTVEFGDPEYTVLADPLDGSFNAKSGIPMFTISLALVEGDPTLGNLVLGYVKNLINADVYHALKGKGAFLNNSPISTSSRNGISVIGMECHPNTILALKQNLALATDDTRLRSLGCISLDLCHVACGIYDTFIDVRGRNTRIVDIAAGKVIVEEAGGIVTNETGESLDEVRVSQETRINLIASGNTMIHDGVIRGLGERGLLI